MKLVYLTAYLIVATSFCFGQSELVDDPSRPKNGIGVNLLGGGALGSIHYNRIFLTKSGDILSTEIGLGYNEGMCLFGCDSRQQYAIVPVKFTANVGKKKHFAELGLGTSILFGNSDQPIVVYPIFGYRILPLNKNRIGFRVNVEIPIGNHLTKTESIFRLKGDMTFFPIGCTISYWL